MKINRHFFPVFKHTFSYFYCSEILPSAINKLNYFVYLRWTGAWVGWGRRRRPERRPRRPSRERESPTHRSVLLTSNATLLFTVVLALVVRITIIGTMRLIYTCYYFRICMSDLMVACLLPIASQSNCFLLLQKCTWDFKFREHLYKISALIPCS